MLNDVTTLLLLFNHPLALDLMLIKSLRDSKKLSPNFNINLLSPQDCYRRFRFDHDDLQQLKFLLKIPDTLRCSRSAGTCSGIEALCILLQRLTYPSRLEDLENGFYKSSADLSYIVNYMLRFIYRRFSDKVTSLNNFWMDIPFLQQYAVAIRNKGAPLADCCGFNDGTFRPICRPTKRQRLFFNGHKRVHAVKYQTVTIPNGLIAHIYGPIPGRRHDSFMLQQSQLIEDLRDISPFYLFADCGYAMQTSIITPFKKPATEVQENFNKVMSKMRVSVEWPYGKILRLFSFNDFKKNQKLFKQPVALYYIISAFFTNCHTCIYGSQIGKYFDLDPPTLSDYLSNE